MAKLFAGLDLSDQSVAICIVDSAGSTLFQTSVKMELTAIARALQPYRRLLCVVGFESGSKARWLYEELKRRGYAVACLDTWHTHAALSAQRNKTDRIDAHGIAMLVQSGRHVSAHVKSDDAARSRLLLTQRRALVRKACDLERALRTSLKEFGATLVKSGEKTSLRQAPRRRDFTLTRIANVMLRAIAALRTEIATLDAMVARTVKADKVCQRLMTAPGVGPLTALSFKTGVDDPARFTSSRTLGAYFGLTPRRHQSGRTAFSTGISKRGDAFVRAALYEAAFSLLHNCHTASPLKAWAVALKQKAGARKATVALSRRLAVVLHRMWVTGRAFDHAR